MDPKCLHTSTKVPVSDKGTIEKADLSWGVRRRETGSQGVKESGCLWSFLLSKEEPVCGYGTVQRVCLSWGVRELGIQRVMSQAVRVKT